MKFLAIFFNIFVVLTLGVFQFLMIGFFIAPEPHPGNAQTSQINFDSNILFKLCLEWILGLGVLFIVNKAVFKSRKAFQILGIEFVCMILMYLYLTL